MDWISIHEQYPPKNPNDPANSVRVLWCDAEAIFPEYAQHVGEYWYPNKKTPGMFTSGNGTTRYIQDIMTHCKRDLYWKPLDPMPQPVKR